MCLHVGKNLRRRPVKLMRCTKRLTTTWNNVEELVTPYQGVSVPNDGFIVPRRRIRVKEKTFTVGTVINGGVIHALVNRSKGYKYYPEYKAYAFGVKAFGTNNDLVAEAVYVPEADKDMAHRRATVRILNKCLRDGNGVPDWHKLRNLPKKVLA